MIRLSFCIFIISIAALLISVTPVAHSQTATGQDQSPLTLKASTRMVVVDVVARDKKGSLVTQMKASDFRLLEDGKEQKLSVFSFQQPVIGEAALPALSAGPLPSNAFRNAPRFGANSALNVILLDALNSSMLEQAYVRSEMVRFLEKLPQGYPVAIFLLGRRLQLLQDFTTDLTELKKVIRELKGARSDVMPEASGTPDTPIELTGLALQQTDMAPKFRAQIEQFAADYSSNLTDERVGRTVAALVSLGRMLSGYRGRKNLIWVSDGVPLTVAPDLRRTKVGYGDQLALLGSLFADAQIAVYPIDARGLVGSPMYNVSNNVSGQGAAGGLAMSMEGKQADELLQAHSNMQEIAQQTGGRAFYNRNDIDNALRNDIEDGSTYYVLGYYPENRNWNGKFRKIQITSRVPDIRLRHREGYFAVDRPSFMKLHPQQRDLDLSQALRLDAPAATTVQFEASVDTVEKDGNKQLVVSYAINPGSIQVEHGEDGKDRAQLDCVVEAFAAGHGDTPVKLAATRVDAIMTSAEYQKIAAGSFPCHVPIDLPQGRYFLRVAIRDNLTGMMGTLNARVDVQP